MIRSSLLVLLALSAACRTNGLEPVDPNMPNPDGSPTAIDVTVELPEDTPTNIRLEANEADGDELTFALTSNPSNGTAVLEGRRVDYTPNLDFFGEDSFTFTATDVDGTSAPATVFITVTPVNDAPRAAVSDAVRLVGQTLTLAAETTDPEGDPITISWAQSSGPTATVPTGDAPTVTVRSAGTYTFTATVSDGTDTDEAIVELRALDVSLATEHVVAVDADGTAWSWGDPDDTFALIGRADPVVGSVGNVCLTQDGPRCGSVLDDVAAVSATENYTLALRQDGTVWGWGTSNDGVLNAPSDAPQNLSGPANLIAISAADTHAIALDASGAVWAWGDPDDDALGNPSVASTIGAADAVPVCVVYDAVSGCTETLQGIVAIDAGRFDSATSMAIDSNGTVWAWGEDSDGILGDGCDQTIGCDDAPVAKPVCAGDDPTSDSCMALTDIAGLAVGGEHALAVSINGDAFAWGLRTSGQLGDGCDLETEDCDLDVTQAQSVCEPGSTGDACAPFSGVAQVSAGHDHTLFLTTAGEVFATGTNDEGELGDGCEGEENCRGDRSTIEAVCAADSGFPCDPLSGIIGIRAGEEVSAALTQDGELLIWGNNSPGLVGNLPEGGPFAIQVGTDTDWSTIDAGVAHAVALKTDGSLWSLGNDDDYAVGNCDLGSDPDNLLDCDNPYAPVPLTLASTGATLPTTWDVVAAGDEHAGAIAADGSVYVWGRADDGALGTSNFDLPIGRPTPMSGLNGIVDLSMGEEFSVALMDDGSILAWGNGTRGQLGDGGEISSEFPVAVLTGDSVTPDTDWIAVEAGEDFVIAQKADGTLWSWGENGAGQLGIGSFDDVTTAVQTLGPEGSPTPTDWEAISAGRNHVAAIRNGQMWVWGNLDEGRRGNGCLLANACELWEEVSTPVPVFGPDGSTIVNDWTQVDAGHDHIIGVRANGAVWAFGEDDAGGMGVGFYGDVSLPAPVCRTQTQPLVACPEFLTGAVDIAASDESGFAILDDGTLWAWGDNDEGRHGYGRTEQSVPTAARWSGLSE